MVQRLTQLGRGGEKASDRSTLLLRTPTLRQQACPTHGPRSTAGVGPLRPKLLNVLPPAQGPTMLARVRASAAQQMALATASSGHRPAIDPTLARLLMQRDTPKTESPEHLAAAPVERALDSILADEVICNMGPWLRAPLGMLQASLAQLLAAAEPGRRANWMAKFVDILRVEHPRPWSSKTPITGLLCSTGMGAAAKYTAALDFLAQPPRDGFEAMASMTIVRSFYMAAEQGGFAASTVPFVTTAANRYVRTLLEQTGRRPIDWGHGLPHQQSAGITAYGEASPIAADWMQPAVHACHRYQPDLTSPHVLHALAYGNAYGVGISGTTNIFLHAAAHHNAASTQRIDALALTAALAAMLCYDGGHSLHETLEAAATFPTLAALELGSLSSYQAGHARTVFASLVDPEGRWLQEKSLQRLCQFVLAAGPST